MAVVVLSGPTVHGTTSLRTFLDALGEIVGRIEEKRGNA